MKHLLYALLLGAAGLLRLPAQAQQATTIEVEKLKPPTAPLQAVAAPQLLKYLRVGVEKTSPLPDSLVDFGDHPILTGFLTAYKEHRPLVISPDIVWLLISQGFARHVGANAAALRGQLVGFEGKKKLKVAVTDIELGNPGSNWEQVFPEFSRQIAAYTGPELAEALTCSFSTTTPTSRIASQITIMEAVKPFFDYEVIMFGCGIPRVTVEGSPADWEQLRAKTRQLGRYQLEWWTQELDPILAEIGNTARGQGRKAFWRNMIKAHTRKQYGSPTTIDGWITKFYPYTDRGERTTLGPIEQINELAPEMVKVPFVFTNTNTGVSTDMECWAGFIGLTQNRRSYAVRPEIAWLIVNKQTSKPAGGLAEQQELADLSVGNIREFPTELYGLRKVGRLHLTFLGPVYVPAELARVQLEELRIQGEVSAAEQQRIRTLFPHVRVFINDQALPGAGL